MKRSKIPLLHGISYKGKSTKYVNESLHLTDAELNKKGHNIFYMTKMLCSLTYLPSFN